MPGNQRRRRSSLAQLTDILREWSGGTKRNQKPPLNRRETLADLARVLPWGRANTEISTQCTSGPPRNPPLRKRRESSADSGIKSMRSRRESHASECPKNWNRDRDRDDTNVTIIGAAIICSPENRNVSFFKIKKLYLIIIDFSGLSQRIR